MKDFNKVMMGAAEGYADQATLGHVKNFTFSFKFEKERIEVDLPMVLLISALMKVSATAGVTLLELYRHDNWLLAMGIGDQTMARVAGDTKSTYWKVYTTRANDTVYALNAFLEPAVLNGCLYEVTDVGSSPHQSGSSPPTYPTTPGNTVVDGDLTLTCRAYNGEAVTMATWNNGSRNAVKLTGTYLTANKVRVYNSGYTAEYDKDDFYIDHTRGEIFQKKTGSITDTQALKVLYEYSETASFRIDMKPKSFVTKYHDFDFKAVSPQTGKYQKLTLFKAKGKLAKVTYENKFSGVPLDLGVYSHPQRSGCKYGRYFWEA